MLSVAIAVVVLEWDRVLQLGRKTVMLLHICMSEL